MMVTHGRPVGGTTLLLGIAFVLSVTACGVDGGTSPESTAAPVTSDTADIPTTVAATTNAPPTSTATPSTTVGPAAPEGLSFSAVQPRHRQLVRRLAIVTTNESAQPVEVTRIALRSDHFAHLAGEEKSSSIGPGSTVHVEVDFGEVADCTQTGTLVASVEMDLRIGDDTEPTPYVFAIEPGPLDVIRAADCHRLSVAETADIGFEDDWVIEGDTIAADLGLERVAGEKTLHVDMLRGSVIFVLEPDPPTEGVVGVLDADAPAVALPVQLRVRRCDPHAVSQSNKTFEFKVWVGIDGSESQVVKLTPDKRLEGALQDLIDSCLAAGGY